MSQVIAHWLHDRLYEIASLDNEIILLAVLIITAAIVIDSISAIADRKGADAGMSGSMKAIGIEGSKTIPVRHYVSDMQRLAGCPDALVVENGFIIPVERKPLARKMHDRYVAQVLVYLRLVEEFEKKRPPYGYLVLGPKCRKFKIENTEARQAWLQKMIDEMHGILDGGDSKPQPHPRKCKKCDVRTSCNFDCSTTELVQIGNVTPEKAA